MYTIYVLISNYVSINMWCKLWIYYSMVCIVYWTVLEPNNLGLLVFEFFNQLFLNYNDHDYTFDRPPL